MNRRAYKQLVAEITCNMWSVTPYSLCDYRCLYCCTNAQGESIPVTTADEALEIVRDAFRTLPTENRLFILGAYSDAYPHPEAKLGITRRIVEELLRMQVRFTIVTKGLIVLRDADLLRQARDLCNVQVSVSCTNDEVLRILEPHAPSGSARFELVRNLYDLGVNVDVNALPWIPDVSDTEEIIRRVPQDIAIASTKRISPKRAGSDRGRILSGFTRFPSKAGVTTVPFLPSRASYAAIDRRVRTIEGSRVYARIKDLYKWRSARRRTM